MRATAENSGSAMAVFPNTSTARTCLLARPLGPRAPHATLQSLKFSILHNSISSVHLTGLHTAGSVARTIHSRPTRRLPTRTRSFRPTYSTLITQTFATLLLSSLPWTSSQPCAILFPPLRPKLSERLLAPALEWVVSRQAAAHTEPISVRHSRFTAPRQAESRHLSNRQGILPDTLRSSRCRLLAEAHILPRRRKRAPQVLRQRSSRPFPPLHQALPSLSFTRFEAPFPSSLPQTDMAQRRRSTLALSKEFTARLPIPAICPVHLPIATDAPPTFAQTPVPL